MAVKHPSNIERAVERLREVMDDLQRRTADAASDPPSYWNTVDWSVMVCTALQTCEDVKTILAELDRLRAEKEDRSCS